LELKEKDVLVVGMGKSGLAAVQLLCEHGARVEACDNRPLEQLKEAASVLAACNVRFTIQSAASFRGRDLIVVSPGVPADLPELKEAQARGTLVIGELELASWFLQGPVIGITGSNGKTTTTAMTGHVLKACGIPCQVGGNIGTPPTSLVQSSRPGQWNVLELSSFQLETIRRFRAQIGVVTNVTPDHLDRHQTLEAYAAAKARLFENQTAEDYAVLNADDPICLRYAATVRGKTLWFSSSKPVTPGLWFDGENIRLGGEHVIAARDFPLRGRHNLENAMAAAAAAHLAGAPVAGITAALKCFPGVEHRLEFVRAVRGVSYYNDSKATNVDATLKALEAFPGGVWIILGGKDKNSDYRPLREPLQAKAKAALLIGKAAPIIAEHLGNAVRQIPCGDLASAVEIAARDAEPGDVVLLAPACASFDQFESFEHRGRVFKQLVGALKE